MENKKTEGMISLENVDENELNEKWVMDALIENVGIAVEYKEKIKALDKAYIINFCFFAVFLILTMLPFFNIKIDKNILILLRIADIFFIIKACISLCLCKKKEEDLNRMAKQNIQIPLLKSQMKLFSIFEEGISKEEFKTAEVSSMLKYNIFRSKNKIVTRINEREVTLSEIRLYRQSVLDKEPQILLDGMYINFKTESFFQNKISLSITKEDYSFDKYLYEDSDEDNVFKNLKNYSEDELYKKFSVIQELSINNNKEDIRKLDVNFVYDFLECFNKAERGVYLFADGNTITLLLEYFSVFEEYDLEINEKLSELENIENIKRAFQDVAKSLHNYIELFENLKLNE